MLIKDVKRLYGAAHHDVNILMENIEKWKSITDDQPIIARGRVRLYDSAVLQAELQS